MLVLDPIPVAIENLPEDFIKRVELPFSSDPEYGVCIFPIAELSHGVEPQSVLVSNPSL
jgi:glutaminyl-tRNA synthetase